ncbi:hypothetical protein [Phenylobacterium sp.]|jgi:membrane associated rhomboid family serine protease|uniref:hypothetical protein n=1 Tax=Phenylobacterium sp. TaxID=1871053 RepID=UPI002F92DFD8
MGDEAEALKALWRAQEKETDPVTLDAIHARETLFVRRARRGQAAGLFVAAVNAASFTAIAWLSADPLLRGGALVVVAGCVWTAWRLGLMARRRAPADAGAIALVDHQRAELIRRRQSFAALMLTAGPMLAGLAVMLLALARRGGAANATALGGALLLWLAGAWLAARRHGARVQRQIDALDREAAR